MNPFPAVLVAVMRDAVPVARVAAVIVLVIGAASPVLGGAPSSLPVAPVPLRESGGVGVPVPPSRGGWKLSAGAIWRDFGDIRFRTGDRSSGVRLPSVFGRSFRVPPPEIGRSDRLGDREYADGFVRLDSGTVTSEDGLTWFWGFDGAGQVRGDRIVFRSAAPGAQTEIERAASDRRVDWEGDGGVGTGPYVELEFTRPVGDRFLMGGHVDFSFVRADTARNGIGTLYERQTARRFRIGATDAFDLGGVVPPDPPYEGSYEGPGPLIPNQPATRSFGRSTAGKETAEFFNAIDESLDIDLFTFGLAWEAGIETERFTAGLAAGPTVSIADWDGGHRERLLGSRNGGRPATIREWNDRESGTDVVFGAFVQGGIGIRLSERIVVEGFVRYDWCESLHGRVGPSSFEAELGGLSGGATLGIRF